MKQNGFTLIETLISIGIIASVGILIAQVFFTTTRVNTKTELLKDVKQNGEYAMDVVSRMIRNSSAVDCSSTPASLGITNSDGSSTTLGCAFDSDNSVNRLASTSATVQYLTSSNVTLGTCTSLIFTCTSSTDQAPTIKVEFKLSQKGTPVDQFEKASVSFQTTVSPRF